MHVTVVKALFLDGNHVTWYIVIFNGPSWPLQRLKGAALFGALEGGFQRPDRVFSAKETAKRPVAGTRIVFIISTFYHSLSCLCPYIDLSD